MKFKKKIVEGDGNCLFRSLELAFGENFKDIRKKVCDFMQNNYNKKIKDTTIRQWIKFESDMGVNEYVEKMRKDGEWGGAIEIMIITKIFNVNVFVVEEKKDGKGYKMISSFISDNKNRNIFLLYSGSHYNYLEVIKNNTDIKT